MVISLVSLAGRSERVRLRIGGAMLVLPDKEKDMTSEAAATSDIYAATAAADKPKDPRGLFARFIGHMLVTMWVLVLVGAWLTGSRVVSLDQLEADIAADNVSVLSSPQSSPKSAWLHDNSTDDISGNESGVVQYQRSNETLGRTYVVAPAKPALDGTWSWGMTSGNSFTWAGEQLERRDAALGQLQHEHPEKRIPETTAHWPPIFTLVMIGCSIVSLGVLLSTRPGYGNRWFWFWLIVGLPAGLGWLAYARLEHLAPQTKERRDGGFVGFFTMIVGSFVFGIALMLLANATGMSVIPS